MDSGLTLPLNGFITAVRNRLWLNSVYQTLPYGIYTSAVLFFTAGLVHRFIVTLPLSGIVLAALLSIVGSILYAVFWRRPTLTAASHCADQLFATKELISSAFELSTHHTNRLSAAAQWTIQQANNCATESLPKLKKIQPLQPFTPAVIAAFAIALGGLFLLLSPGAQTHTSQPFTTPASQESPPLLQTSPVNKKIAMPQPEAMTTLRESTFKQTRNNEKSTLIPSTDKSDRGMIPTDTEYPPTQSAILPQKNVINSNSGKLPFTGNEPSDQQANVTASPAFSAPLPARAITTFDILLQGSATTHSGAAELRQPTIIGGRIASNITPTAAQTVIIPYKPALSPVQRRHIADYFNTVELTDP